MKINYYRSKLYREILNFEKINETEKSGKKVIILKL